MVDTGVNLASTIPGGGYALMSAPSFATPVPSGTLALGEPSGMAAAGQLAVKLDTSGRNINAANLGTVHGNSGMLGHGVVDVRAFLSSLK